MNEWKEVKFDKLFLEPVRNGIYKSSEFQGKGIKIVNMKELFGFEFIGKQEMRKIELNQIEKSKFLLKEADLLFARRSIVESGAGKTSIVKDLNGEMTFESSIIRMRLNQSMAFPLFYYYYLSSGVGRSLITALSSGTNVKGIKGSDLKNVKINLPPLPTQRKIASILSAYDDLIENNLRRIKLLEELAQRTYEEWFVKFTIHGQKLPVKEETGLPEGWVKKSMTEIAEFLNGFAFKPSDFQKSGKPIIKIKEMKNGIGNETPYNDGGRVPAKYLIKSGDILFSWSGSLEVIIWQNENGWLNQHLFKVTPNDGFQREFVHHSLLKTLNEFNNLTTGATMKHIKRKELDFVKVPVPSLGVMEEFDQIIKPVQEKILKLSRQNRLLKESRDILLPRLMNGTISVEAGEEQMMVAAEPEVKFTSNL